MLFAKEIKMLMEAGAVLGLKDDELWVCQQWTNKAWEREQELIHRWDKQRWTFLTMLHTYFKKPKKEYHLWDSNPRSLRYTTKAAAALP